MNKANTAFLTVGKLGTSYGVKGWLKVHTYTELGASILDYTPWYARRENQAWQVLDVEEARLHGKDVIVKLVNIHTPEEARLFTGQEIAVKREQLPSLKKDEYYWSDLVGLTVLNKQGENYGKVSYLMATGSNDVLVVKGEKEHAIPFLWGTVILKVDLEKQEIHVDWELL